MIKDLSVDINTIKLELAKRSYLEFVKQAWTFADPGSKLLPNWHIEVLCNHLQAVFEGKIKKIVINMPFRLGKSQICSVLFPAWCWIHHPGLKVIVVSYNMQLSTMISLRIRNLITSDYYTTLAPNVQLSESQSQKSFFINTFGGQIMSATTSSSVTGQTANMIILDDPMSSSTASSATERESANLNVFEGYMTRLSPPGKGSLICVSQRLHTDDTAGMLLKNPEYERLILPMVFEGIQRSRTSLNFQDPRKEDELLFPEFFPRSQVESFKLGLDGQGGGRQFYNSQLQQDPTPSEGNLFLREHFKWFEPTVLPTFSRLILSFDTAFKTAAHNDFSVGLAIGEAENGFYIIDMCKDKLPYYALKDMIISFYNKHDNVYAVIIEDKASGQSILQDLRAQTRLPIMPSVLGVNMVNDKVGRAQLTSAHSAAGRLFVPKNTAWVHDFISEVCSFPASAHDDIVDALTQGINYLLSTRSKASARIL